MNLLFPVVLAGAVFIWLTGSSLPPNVASHFASGGAANGFMPRAAYLSLMLALEVGLPLSIGVVPAIASRLPARFINLPNRDYRLAPERVEGTRTFLRRHGSHLSVLLAAFLCFIHWLVVAANRQSPARFPETSFFAGAAVFVFALALWFRVFFVRFRQ